MNSQASQSSSSGCDGGSLCVPRSSLVLTNPVPKYACQTRLTNARAVVGDLRSTSQRAKVSRVGSQPSGSGCRKAGTPAVTSLPGLSQSPRLSIVVVRPSSRAIKVSAVVPSGHCSQRASIRSLASLNSGTVVRQ